MDSLSSLGKVRTMEEDLAAARNKQRLSGNSGTLKKEDDMVAEEIRVPIAPIPQTQKEAPTPSILSPNPQPIVPPIPPAIKQPAAISTPPSLSPARGLLPRPTLPTARQTVPPLIPRRPEAKPTMPAVPPRQNLGEAIGQTTRRQNLPPLLPVEEVEEEEGKLTSPIEVKKTPFAGAPPSLSEKILAPVRPQGLPADKQSTQLPTPAALKSSVPPVSPVVPQIQAKGMTPEEILGINPPAGGFRATPPPSSGFHIGASLPPLPITQRAIKTIPTPPVQPKQPISPVLPPPPIYQSSYGEKKGLPLGLIAGVVVLIVAVGGFFVWRTMHTNVPPKPQPNPPPVVVVNPPSPFFAPDSTNIITLQQGRESFLIEQIRTLESTPGNAQSIAYIPIKKSSDNTFLGAKDFFSTIGVSIPQELLSDVDNQFMLYLYTPGAEEKTRCAASNITDASCSSPRLGIVLKINNGKETAVQNIMAGLEPTLIQSFTPLILDTPAFDKATPWTTVTYKGLTVRYSNLPISTTSLNWAKIGSYLVIATSKNSSYAVLNKFITPPPSPLP